MWLEVQFSLQLACLDPVKGDLVSSNEDFYVKLLTK